MEKPKPIPNGVIFRHEGVLYDTSNLRRIETSDPEAPTVFLANNSLRGFVVSLEEKGNYRVRSVMGAELQRIVAQRLQ